MSMQTANVAAAYDRWAPIYDLVFGNVFAAGRAQSIAEAERIGGRVLEVGIGTGISLPRYSAATRLVGVDISDAMLEKARARTRRHGLSNVEQIRQMDAERLEFADGEFDVVVAQYVVTAMPDPERALAEFVRVLRPGGEIIITTRIGAEKGLREKVERLLMPITTRLGWRTEFQWERYEAWAARTPQVELAERRLLPPLGHFSLLRYRKIAG